MSSLTASHVYASSLAGEIVDKIRRQAMLTPLTIGTKPEVSVEYRCPEGVDLIAVSSYVWSKLDADGFTNKVMLTQHESRTITATVTWD